MRGVTVIILVSCGFVAQSQNGVTQRQSLLHPLRREPLPLSSQVAFPLGNVNQLRFPPTTPHKVMMPQAFSATLPYPDLFFTKPGQGRETKAHATTQSQVTQAAGALQPLYKVEGDICEQTMLDKEGSWKRKWVFFTTQGFQDGDCASQGFNKKVTSKMANFIMIGESEMLYFKTDGSKTASQAAPSPAPKTTAPSPAPKKEAVKDKPKGGLFGGPSPAPAKPKAPAGPMVTLYKIKGDECTETTTEDGSSWMKTSVNWLGYKKGDCSSFGYTSLIKTTKSSTKEEETKIFKKSDTKLFVQSSPDISTAATVLIGVFAVSGLVLAVLSFGCRTLTQAKVSLLATYS